jgi:CheY-like chemotaxis protein
MILNLAANMLQELGCRVVVSSSGRDALRVLKAEPGITVLLTDIQMLGMDGVELAAEARRVRRDLHVVFASGGTGVGGELFLAMPFSREELLHAIHC